METALELLGSPLKIEKYLIKQEGLKESAIRDLQSSKIQSGCKAARVYGLPRTSLQGRLKGRRPLAESNATKRKLTSTEEETLIKRVLSLTKRGYPPRPIFIENWANLLLANRGSDGPIERVGINWKSTFINRHPEVKSVYYRGFHYQQAKCEDRKVIQPWFELVRTTIAEYGIDSSDIYNFDETGFAMGLIKSAKVIIGAETTNKEAFVLQPGKREWVTAIEAVNSTGTRTVGRYRLFILDGHGSHSTPEFDTTCIENNIISLCMPAHTSHLCQPLDISIFSPLKKSYYKHNGFAATGLIPLNPGRVLEKLNIQLKTPTPPGSSHGTSQSQSSCFQTPSNPHELKQHSIAVKKRLDPLFSSPSNPTLVKLNQVYKSCEIAWHNATLLAQENMELRTAIQKEDQKHKRTKKVITEEASLIRGEAQSFIDESNAANQLAASLVSVEDGLPRRRAPPTCSDCHRISHTRRQCPNRTS
ncbi:conserved hypothetical protein [Talaromyces stipitatus ATCC 10500]|uniref:HTH CENPB-type domain-containing protein n=1 Tax=Talaromyces stipitatus (strain ATCC 10500 / CBS 375.48 / QM 6759 / NRRL 1006) TaxID=441959 RepID=B8MSA4_TALSN|nr:uncharacterized protein TSTA_002990 [Talaromyces stipitatus ATCC 10500]EED12237.1 conserved hypothetical protein [Talaromyces stipitatus ATCC 10500]